MNSPPCSHATRAALVILALLAALPSRSMEPSLPACLAGAPVVIVVRIGTAPAPRRAWLRGGVSPALQIVDAETAQALWSAAAGPPASQQFNSLRAQFAGGLLPVDLDGDGVHDRIYAGDLAGRLWRFDLHHGLPADQWATGGVFADLSAGTPRGFVAAPDVSLARETEPPENPSTWFNISLGTVRLGSTPVENRLYVLRDRFPFESWSQQQYDHWRPLREQDLALLPRLGAALTQPAPDGYFIVVGSADILSPTLTVSGRATLALAEPGTAPGPGCSIAAKVSAIELSTGREAGITTTGESGPVRLPVSMVAGEAFTLRREGSQATCLLGETRLPSCDADLAPRRTWWRREDAD